MEDNSGGVDGRWTGDGVCSDSWKEREKSEVRACNSNVFQMGNYSGVLLIWIPPKQEIHSE